MTECYSPKQQRVLTWWMPGKADAKFDAILCEGAVRSGKTMAMGLGFFFWASCCFQGKKFGLCGKTIGALRRNMLTEVLPKLRSYGAICQERRSENRLTVKWLGRENDFYIFGGRDEGAADLIQGITFAGVLLDEAALMPRAFVEQACARCSVTGSRIWFNCNPAGPGHWFYKNWVLKAQEKNCLRLHFTMADNPSLSEGVRRRFEGMYTGVFYQRFILGQWVQAEGRIYDFFTEEMLAEAPESCEEWYISCDYGTVNPMSMGLWGRKGESWYRVKEFYYDSKKEGTQMTDEEYADALEELASGREIQAVVVDPSAASFQESLRRRGWRVKKARNEVLSGIRQTADLLKGGKIRICRDCLDCLEELENYVWEEGSGMERVKKEHDHAMDDMRYFVSTVLSGKEGGFAAVAVERQGGNV